MKKKFLTIALILLLTSLVLTGCGANAKEEKKVKATVSSFLTDYKNCKGDVAKYLSNNFDNREMDFSDKQQVFAKKSVLKF